MSKNSKLKWRIIKDGDVVERQYWPDIKGQFPNYEVFWSLFIVPLTRRVCDRRDVHFREKMDPLIEEITMAHYTIFRSLCFVLDEKNRFGSESLRSVYFHFGLIIEMVYLLCWRIYSVKCKVGLESEEVVLPLEEDEVVQKVKLFMQENYKNQYEDYVNKGRPVIYYLHSQKDVLNKIIKNTTFLTKTNNFFKEIKDYRNTFIHSPVPGSLSNIDSKSGKEIRFAIKKDKIKEYKLWTDITHNFRLNTDDFIAEEQLIEEDFHEIQKILNEIWNYLIIEMDNITRKEKYKELTRL